MNNGFHTNNAMIPSEGFENETETYVYRLPLIIEKGIIKTGGNE
jgi:hypothetical protein